MTSFVPIPVAARSKVHMVSDGSVTEIVGSNPAQGIDICPHVVCVCMCCPVQVEALRWGDPPSKESY